MTQMFTIPANIILVLGFAMVVATIGYVIYGCVKGWENVTKDYKQRKQELTIDG
ncbi:MAG: hypothetical protein NTW71_12220 [Deltaproteobacteria bacterium]|nr:hypothetical protein [Deltaproteobacteria bacterium]